MGQKLDFFCGTHTHCVKVADPYLRAYMLVVLVPVHYFIHSSQRTHILILTQVGNFFPIRGTLWNCIRYHFFNIRRRSGNLLIRIKIAEWQVSYTPRRLGRFPHTQIGTLSFWKSRRVETGEERTNENEVNKSPKFESRGSDRGWSGKRKLGSTLRRKDSASDYAARPLLSGKGVLACDANPRIPRGKFVTNSLHFTLTWKQPITKIRRRRISSSNRVICVPNDAPYLAVLSRRVQLHTPLILFERNHWHHSQAAIFKWKDCVYMVRYWADPINKCQISGNAS